MKTDSKFYNKSEELTRYAFACGYQKNVYGNRGNASMWMEHTVFHVTCSITGGSSEWKSFDSNELTLARKQFKIYSKLVK